MFRSSFHDHLQGSSFVLSAFTTLLCHSSFLGMWPYAIYLYVTVVPACGLSGREKSSRPDNPQTGTPDTHTNRWHTATYPKKTNDKAGSGRVVNALNMKDDP
jgi:hypothetical protein